MWRYPCAVGFVGGFYALIMGFLQFVEGVTIVDGPTQIALFAMVGIKTLMKLLVCFSFCLDAFSLLLLAFLAINLAPLASTAMLAIVKIMNELRRGQPVPRTLKALRGERML